MAETYQGDLPEPPDDPDLVLKEIVASGSTWVTLPSGFLLYRLNL